MSLIAPPCPLVVQVGFAGERKFGRGDWAEPAIQDQLVSDLLVRFRKLREDLQLHEQHFLCGISQLAVGGDLLFTRACQATPNMPQRIFLPQHWEDYLTAEGTAGPDFLEHEQQAARELFASPHLIQERVVTNASQRRDRFDDVSLELLRVSDVLICLVVDPDPGSDFGEQPEGKQGGTRSMLDYALRRKLPVIEWRVSIREGKAVWWEKWHHLSEFRRPQWPGELSLPPRASVGLPSGEEYCQAVKTHASELANHWRIFFTDVALWIMTFHVLATVCAVTGIAWHPAWLVPLLEMELGLLLVGLGIHEYLHLTHAARVWAKARLIAEIARSTLAIGNLHVYQDYLFVLPFPRSVLPILRTINVLHLRSTRAGRDQDWKPLRDAYLKKRLYGPKGQVLYFRERVKPSKKWAQLALWAFRGFSGLACLATLVKVMMLVHFFPMDPSSAEAWEQSLGTLAIMLPILAIAALSLAAAHDVEGRVRTYEDMSKFLDRQVGYLEAAQSEREFAKLMMETESHLLGETVIWYSRRAHTGV